MTATTDTTSETSPDDSPSSVPEQPDYGDAAAEYDAARTAIAIFDCGQRTRIECRGADRAKFLHNFCTNDVVALSPGSGCEAFLTNVKARILAHVRFFAQDDCIVIDADAGLADGIMTHLERYIIMEDVVLANTGSEYRALVLSGPNTVAAIAQVFSVDVETFALHQHTVVSSAGESALLARVDSLGSPTFLLSVSINASATIWNVLVVAGCRPAGAAAWQALRIEVGTPICGVDLTENHLAPEAGRNHVAISFRKGCYLGQEPIARIDALGHVNRELRAIDLDDACQPAAGTDVLAADGTARIGRISSSAVVPGSARTVALGMINRGSLAADTPITVNVDGRTISGRIRQAAASY